MTRGFGAYTAASTICCAHSHGRSLLKSSWHDWYSSCACLVCFAMWRFVSSGDSGKHPWLQSLNGFAGRQTWEYTDEASSEEKAQIQQLQDGFTRFRHQQRHSADELLRMQSAAKRRGGGGHLQLRHHARRLVGVGSCRHLPHPRALPQTHRFHERQVSTKDSTREHRFCGL